MLLETSSHCKDPPPVSSAVSEPGCPQVFRVLRPPTSHPDGVPPCERCCWRSVGRGPAWPPGCRAGEAGTGLVPDSSGDDTVRSGGRGRGSLPPAAPVSPYSAKRTSPPKNIIIKFTIQEQFSYCTDLSEIFCGGRYIRLTATEAWIILETGSRLRHQMSSGSVTWVELVSGPAPVHGVATVTRRYEARVAWSHDHTVLSALV